MRWLLYKDLQILRRSPLLVALLVLYPVLLAALVGFAVTAGPSKPRVALLNQLASTENQVQLGGENVNLAKEAKPLFDAVDVVKVQTRQEALQKVRDGDALAALVLPPDIATKLQEAVSGSGPGPTVQVYYNAEDPAKKSFVDNTIKARVEEANFALTKKVSQVALGYLNLIGSGGQFSFLGQSFNVLGLQRSEQILTTIQNQLPKNSPQRAQIGQVAQFAKLARQNLNLAGPLLASIGTPLKVRTHIVSGGSPPLGAFAAAVAASVTLMLVTVLIAAGALALEREENAFRRLVRGLVSRTGVLVEKIGLATLCSIVVGVVLLVGLSLFVNLPYARFPAWLVALLFGAAGFAALGVAMGAAAREVRTASLLAFMVALPIAALGLVPSGAVNHGLFEAIKVVSAIFPFRPTLHALDSALGRSGSLWQPLLHLAVLTVAWTAVARLALRRFA